MRNYCGIIVSPKFYSELGYIVENKLVFNSHTNDEQSRERLWFMCGYDDSILIVIYRGSKSEDMLIESGMLLDLRVSPNVRFPSSFFDYALHKLSSRSERVRLCNELRNAFALRSKYRWCGAELESLFNVNVIQNACEINGLAALGRLITGDGIVSGSYPEIITTNYSYNLLRHIESFEDLGQRKLAALFHSIAIAHTSIVYVGSAPGDAWISALEMYPHVERVISIDPRKLSNHSDARISHSSECVLNANDLYSKIEEYTNCVLIWDVRGDAVDNEVRDLMIINEISILNEVLIDSRLEERFMALHLKINMRHISHYELPRGGRFMIQPYTLLRDVFESRYVVHLRSGVTVDYFSPNVMTRNVILQEMDEVKKSLLSGDIGEGHLVANLMCSRYRQVNYIERKAYNSPHEEIVLFSINHNSPSDVLKYLDDLKKEGRSYLISYFTGQLKDDDPYDFPEGDVTLRCLGTILDSRSFIKCKIDGLYLLLSDNLLSLMNEELYTSETYKIRRTEYAIANRSRVPAYDTSRFEVCAERNLCFPKFPSAFSINQSLVSPSGHSLRMAIEYMDGRASISMLAQKIVNNFRNYKRSYVRSDFGMSLTKPEESTFASILRHNGSRKSTLERSPPSIWHSKLEWILGIEAAVKLRNPPDFPRSQLKAVCEFIDRIVTCPLPGTEISTFMNRAFGRIDPLSSVRTRNTRGGFEDPDKSSIDVASDLYKVLSGKDRPDPVKWLTSSSSSRSSVTVWREAIQKLQADACARDLAIHTTIISLIDPDLKDHDCSKRNPLEFTLNIPPTKGRSTLTKLS